MLTVTAGGGVIPALSNPMVGRPAALGRPSTLAEPADVAAFVASDRACGLTDTVSGGAAPKQPIALCNRFALG